MENHEMFEDDVFDIGDDLAKICEGFLENTGNPYDMEQAECLIEWLQSIRMEETLISLVVEGKVNVIVDPSQCKEDCLTFTISEWFVKELELDDDNISNIFGSAFVDPFESEEE